MRNDFRGGNSRQLARQLDSLDVPMAFLDRKGQIVFVNAALCEMANGQATQLVGRQTSWQIPPDETPFHSILMPWLLLPASAVEKSLPGS